MLWNAPMGIHFRMLSGSKLQPHTVREAGDWQRTTSPYEPHIDCLSPRTE